MKFKGNNVVILRFSALGDVAMTLPVAYSVAKSYPDYNFYFYTRPFFTKLFINAPANLHAVGVDPSKTPETIARIKDVHPSAIVDLHNVSRSWIIDAAFRLRGKAVAMVRKERSKRKNALSNHLVQQDFISRYCETISRLGFNFDLSFTSIFPNGVDSPIELKRPALGIAPFARYATKTYPQNQMEELIKVLTSKGVNVYLFGGGIHETEIIDHWAKNIDGVTSVAGKYKIDSELAIMANLDAMLSMDSANQHLAAITGTRVFTIWGATTPICGFMPWHQNLSDSFVANVPCQPCSVAGGPKCPNATFACFKALKPTAIADHIIKCIK